MFPDSSIGNAKAHFGGLFLFQMFFSNFDSMTKRNRVLFVLWVILLTSIALSLFVKYMIVRQYEFENHSEIPKNNY